MPWAYIELYLCRNVYHCTPSELYEQDANTVMLHLKLINVENIVRDFNKSKSTGR